MQHFDQNMKIIDLKKKSTSLDYIATHRTKVEVEIINESQVQYLMLLLNNSTYGKRYIGMPL